MGFAQTVKNQLKAAGVRVSIDDRNEKIGKKIRDTELQRVPYMLVVGEKEVSEGRVSIRRQGKGDAGTMSIEEFVTVITREIKERSSGD